MDELIERLRSFVVERGKIARGSDIVTTCNNSALSLSDLRALLDALEAAREDAAEAKQNGYELGLLAGAQEAERLRGVIARYERKLDAALEAAREDAERLDSGKIRIIERDEFGMQHTTAYSGVDLRAAIDQARGKGGGEVEGG